MDQPVFVYDRIASNRRRTWLLLALFALLALPPIAYVAQYLAFVLILVLGPLFGPAPSAATVIAVTISLALGIVAAAAWFEYRKARAIVLRMAGARPLAVAEPRELERAVENMAIASGLPRLTPYVIESRTPTAFSAGMSDEETVLVVSRGLLSTMPPREIEAVVAHEYIHVGNGDTQLVTLLAAAVATLRLPGRLVWRAGSSLFRWLFRIHWLVGGAALLYAGFMLFAILVTPFQLLDDDPWFAIFLFVACLVPFYVLALAHVPGVILSRLIARDRDYIADAGAFLLTRQPEWLAAALIRLDAAAAAMPSPLPPPLAHLAVVPPSGGHEDVAGRVAAISAMGGGIPPLRLEAVRDAAASAAHDAASSRAPLVQYEPVVAAESPAGDSAHPHAVLVAEDGAPLRARPEPDAPILSTLDAGAKLVVIAEHGAFYEVITPNDRFGYVARETTYGALSLDDALGRRPGAPDAVA